MHAKRVCNDVGIKDLSQYHDLYLTNDTLLFADVSENLRTMWLEIYQLDPVKTVSASGLAWQQRRNRPFY